MKKIFLPGLMLLFSIAAFAQKQNLEIGFQGGINFNRAYGDKVTNSLLSSTNGLSAGAHIRWKMSTHFSITALPSYDQFGWSYRSLVYESGLFTGSKSDLFYKLDYLNLPVLAGYSVGKKIKWNLNAGVFTGLLLKGRIIEKNSPPLATGQSAEVESKLQGTRNFNFGIVAATGIQVPLTSGIWLNVDIRNVTGLIKTFESAAASSSSKTLTYSFLSGLSFQL